MPALASGFQSNSLKVLIQFECKWTACFLTFLSRSDIMKQRAARLFKAVTVPWLILIVEPWALRGPIPFLFMVIKQ